MRRYVPLSYFLFRQVIEKGPQVAGDATLVTGRPVCLRDQETACCPDHIGSPVQAQHILVCGCGCDPDVVDWNGRALGSKGLDDLGIEIGGGFIYGMDAHPGRVQKGLQLPCFASPGSRP